MEEPIKTKHSQLMPDFIEKNILIPKITTMIQTISLLFEQMKEILHDLQDENTAYSQSFNKDFTEMLMASYQEKFPNTNPKQIEDAAKNEANKIKQTLQEGFSSHLKQYKKRLKDLGLIHSHENNIEKISEYMLNVKIFMLNIVQLKKMILSYAIPMTTLVIIDSKTKKEIKRFPKDHPVEKIGLLPFDTRIDEISSLCENGVKSIDSWFKHLKDKRIQHMENIVNKNKVQSAKEQTKVAKWTFYTQLGFMILSVLFVIASFCLSEYKEDWIYLFKDITK